MVVPANAGTHTPRPSFQTLFDDFRLTRTVAVMGPGSRFAWPDDG